MGDDRVGTVRVPLVIEPIEVAAEADPPPRHVLSLRRTPDTGVRPPRTGVPLVGLWAWSFVGVVAALAIVVGALAAVSEVVLPLILAAVLAVMFKPLAEVLQRHRIKPTLAAGAVVLGLLVVMGGVVYATIRGVIAQTDEIGAVTDAAIDTAAEELEPVGVDEAGLDDVQAATESALPIIAGGLLTLVVSGVGTLIGFASGVVLGALIMYYLLKDGRRLRAGLVEQFGPQLREDVDGFVGDACRLLRAYGRGRTVMSTVVALVVGTAALLLGLPLVFTIVVVNFIGGYVPYIGAFLGGGLAVIVALGDGGVAEALIMLAVVLVSNLMLENLVEPKVMGDSLHIHPLVVLLVTALGGIVGGIVGLILAVPAFVIGRSAFTRFGSRGLVERVADRAEPTVQRLLQ